MADTPWYFPAIRWSSFWRWLRLDTFRVERPKGSRWFSEMSFNGPYKFSICNFLHLGKSRLLSYLLQGFTLWTKLFCSDETEHHFVLHDISEVCLISRWWTVTAEFLQTYFCLDCFSWAESWDWAVWDKLFLWDIELASDIKTDLAFLFVNCSDYIASPGMSELIKEGRLFGSENLLGPVIVTFQTVLIVFSVPDLYHSWVQGSGKGGPIVGRMVVVKWRKFQRPALCLFMSFILLSCLSQGHWLALSGEWRLLPAKTSWISSAHVHIKWSDTKTINVSVRSYSA